MMENPWISIVMEVLNTKSRPQLRMEMEWTQAEMKTGISNLHLIKTRTTLWSEIPGVHIQETLENSLHFLNELINQPINQVFLEWLTCC